MTVKAARLRWSRISLAVLILSSLLLSATAQNLLINSPANVHAQPVDPTATIAPSTVWGPLFGTSGDVEIDVNRIGIAVRVEIPREFLEGNSYQTPVISTENDTHFIESNIRNDYYYYSVVDESRHWSYNATANGPCFKPRFSIRDPNAPWCVEIWNYLNGTFRFFNPPKFVRFHNLNAPSIAGSYNFTVFIANQTNLDAAVHGVRYKDECNNPAKIPPEFCSFPDFVDAWNTTLHVPVSMRDRPASIAGTICDNWFSTPLTCGGDHIILGTKGVAYAKDLASGQIVGKSFVNETTGQFNITGLAQTSPPGYQILASAGFDPTYDTAYSLTANPSPVTVGAGENRGGVVVALDRAPQVCGHIQYPPNIHHSLTDHPYLPETGLKVLNITVEGVDSQQHVYRNTTLSQNTNLDDFKLITGSNVTYVGTDPYGTEFAGLPPASPSYTVNVNVWITGYLQAYFDGSLETVTATVSASPSPGSSFGCSLPEPVSPSPILMQVGGVISGTIQLWNGEALETPHQAEVSLPLPPPPTDALFGGNILIQAYDHTGILRGVTVLNGTLPDGRTCYADSTLPPLCNFKVIQVASGTGIQLELAFTIIGFSEYLNHTWSGVWGEKDYGIPPDSGYSVQVFIRGYALQTTSTISVALGQNATTNLKMLRGGAFQIGVVSYDNRFGTRALQAAQPFLFLNLSIPVRARTYFYDSSGISVGYVECIIRTAVAQPDRLCQRIVSQNSFTVIFAGQNWSLRDIWFYGDTPTHVGNDTYTIKTYTLGYVWQYGPSQSPNDLLGFTQLLIPLLIGDELDITGPVFHDPQSLGTLPENEYATGQAFLSGGLLGAVPGNFTEGTPTLSFSIFGFGGMTNSTKVVTGGVPTFTTGKLEGQGHFFYVSPEGSHLNCDFTTNCYFDYGLNNATYTAQVPEFGFLSHFMQPVPPSTVTFADLFLQTGVVMEDIQMGRVISDPLVTGWANLPGFFDIAPLSWVQVTASNATFTRTVTTLDGHYGGPGALFLPAGTYDITFWGPTQPAYYTSQTRSSLQVQWGATTVVDPPSGPLCPILPPAITCP